MNVTMRKRHCTHTTINKQKTMGTLQSCTDVVFYVAAPCPFNQNSATARNQAATSHELLYQHPIQRSALTQACHGQCAPVAHHGAMLAFNVSMLPTQSIAANSLHQLAWALQCIQASLRLSSSWYNTETITQLLLSLQCATMLADQLPALPQSCNPTDWAIKCTHNPTIKAWLLSARKINPACILPPEQSSMHREHLSRLPGYVGC